MSVNRENVTWQSKDGKWNIGFFDFYETNFGEDFDYEWDVEYHHDKFWFVSQGHASPEEAYQSYTRHHANPGGTWHLPYSEETADQIAKYEEYAAKFRSKVLA